MNENIAVIDNGIVVNIAVVDSSDGLTIMRLGGQILPEDSNVAVGWTYDGLAFKPPVLSIEEKNLIIDSQITDLERQQMMPRITRETLLATAVTLAAAQGITESQLYTVQIAYRKLKDFDSSIAALRAKRG